MYEVLAHQGHTNVGKEVVIKSARASRKARVKTVHTE
jgi:hypothetical protein